MQKGQSAHTHRVCEGELTIGLRHWCAVRDALKPGLQNVSALGRAAVHAQKPISAVNSDVAGFPHARKPIHGRMHPFDRHLNGKDPKPLVIRGENRNGHERRRCICAWAIGAEVDENRRLAGL